MPNKALQGTRRKRRAPELYVRRPTVANRRGLPGVNRVVALALAAIWLCAGVAGIVVGVAYGRWLLVTFAIFAVWYAVLWFRVVARSRLLTWRELAAPWRAG
jgi:hypothetical protein